MTALMVLFIALLLAAGPGVTAYVAAKWRKTQNQRDLWYRWFKRSQKKIDELQGKIDRIAAHDPVQPHCVRCSRFLSRDTSLHVQTPDGPVCGRCWEKLNRKEQ